MSNKNPVENILSGAAWMARAAGEGAVQLAAVAGQALEEKVDTIKLNMAFRRAQKQQDEIFREIGRLSFLLQTWAGKDTAQSVNAQQAIDQLLLQAGGKQAELDQLQNILDGWENQTCAACGSVCDGGDSFCWACGTALHSANTT